MFTAQWTIAFCLLCNGQNSIHNDAYDFFIYRHDFVLRIYVFDTQWTIEFYSVRNGQNPIHNEAYDFSIYRG